MSKIISFAGTKGGVLKSTLTQCISTSKTFQKYKVIILEADKQDTLIDWIEDRKDPKLKPFKIKIIKHDKKGELKEEIEKYKNECDFLFIDLPGESEALTLTRTALAYSDLSIFPLKMADKDTKAFDKNLRPVIKKLLTIRDKKHFKILLTFAHHSTKKAEFKKNFEAIKMIDKFNNIHRDRSIFNYFSGGGITLREYQAEQKPDSKEYEKALKAIEDIELISKEILQTIL